MSSNIEIPKARKTSTSSLFYRSPKSSSWSSNSSSASAVSIPSSPRVTSRRPSLLSTSLAKQECTVINVGEPEGPPRLISYLSSSQGFDWNPEIFLPSYIHHDYVPLENRQEPVHEIRLTDEESRSMLPE